MSCVRAIKISAIFFCCTVKFCTMCYVVPIIYTIGINKKIRSRTRGCRPPYSWLHAENTCHSPRISIFPSRGDPPPSLNNQPIQDNFYGVHRRLCYGGDERSLFTAITEKSSLFIKLIPTKSSIHTILIIVINLLNYSSL
jgi:hypothetical protein